ncbi:alpha/beta hydrolase [Lacisediminihabitans changchengi]|uniref:Alpha/beta hydrolase n=1 Tax=Lacisediminihabitans changchengi TaxID=2787634 RepID=A0A934ST89_9MICO|nr:alpha/beta hydrolase [Lacisediminihabitans changchengi]MBK4348530.1 alpha/beta hydrolase [Lacisediminihabitans changchengi]
MRRRLLAAVTGAMITLALVGCSAGRSTPSQESVTIPQPAYPQFKTYPSVLVKENVTFRRDGERRERLNVCQPQKKSDGDRAGIVLVHGGSWRAGDKSSPEYNSVCQWLASAGFVVFSLDYRLAPEFPFPDGLDDVKAAVRWVRSHADDYSVDPARIGAMGGSAGGNLVSMLGTAGHGSRAAGARVAAVAELSGPADLTTKGAELPNFIPLQLAYLKCEKLSDCASARKASPIYQVDVTDPPFFVGHSLNERIPLSQSEAFVKELRAHGVSTTFVTVRGSLHSIAMLGPNMKKRIVAFFHEHLDPI